MWRDTDFSTVLSDLLRSGLRAWAKGPTFVFKDSVYGVYFVRYKHTMSENQGGRYN